ncbi:hypothetical protein [Pediococcus ethanolidurans]
MLASWNTVINYKHRKNREIIIIKAESKVDSKTLSIVEWGLFITCLIFNLIYILDGKTYGAALTATVCGIIWSLIQIIGIATSLYYWRKGEWRNK